MTFIHTFVDVDGYDVDYMSSEELGHMKYAITRKLGEGDEPFFMH